MSDIQAAACATRSRTVGAMKAKIVELDFRHPDFTRVTFAVPPNISWGFKDYIIAGAGFREAPRWDSRVDAALVALAAVNLIAVLFVTWWAAS